MSRDNLSLTAQSLDYATGVNCVPRNNGGNKQVVCRCPDLKVFLIAVTEAAKTM